MHLNRLSLSVPLALVAALGLLLAVPGCATTGGGSATSRTATPEAQFHARMLGKWHVQFDPETLAQFEAAKAQADANPEDEVTRAMVDMMEALMASMNLDIRGETMRLAIGDESDDVSWRVISASRTGGVIESTDADGAVERLNVVFKTDDHMLWTMDDKDEPMAWVRIR